MGEGGWTSVEFIAGRYMCSPGDATPLIGTSLEMTMEASRLQWQANRTEITTNKKKVPNTEINMKHISN
jgi:hypothetical protein